MEILVILAIVAVMVALAGLAAQERRIQVRVPVRIERQRHIRRR
jgi:Tfp pilus assembly protein FimT